MPEDEIILLVDDDASDRNLIRAALSREGYTVLEAEMGEEGLELYDQNQPAIVLLDVVLPGMDGLELCRRLRSRGDVPIMIISARDEEVDKVVGLELGADDYMTKPFGTRELVARVRAMLRRTVLTEQATAQQKQLSYPDLELDLPTRTVRVKDEVQHLTPKEFDLLFFLASEPRRVFSREEIVENVWGYSPVGKDLRTVDTHVKRLRQKLEEKYDVPWSIATVWGVGYKFEVNK
ncbi:MAG: response regulator transcription factor [Armatimonadota bacterium]